MKVSVQLKQNKTNKYTLEKYRSHDFNNLLLKYKPSRDTVLPKSRWKIWIKTIWYFKYICQLQPFEHYHQISKCCFLVNVYIYSG